MIAGDSVGPYRVLDKLGEGGMSEVYRARDTKFDREVALKILPESFASDPDRLTLAGARLEMEQALRTARGTSRWTSPMDPSPVSRSCAQSCWRPRDAAAMPRARRPR